MKIRYRIIAVVAAILLFYGSAQAAEIRVIATNAVTEVMAVLGPQYERATSNKLIIRYDVTNVLKSAIEAGEAFDVAILVVGPVTDALIQAGKLNAASRSDIARSGIGVAYRAGATKPDIGTAEAFRQTMINAKSIGYTTQGASGQYFMSLAKRLGITDQIKAKSVVLQGGRVAELVAKGDAEFAVQQMSELLPVNGVEVLPLPRELQSYSTFAGFLSDDAKDPKTAKVLLEFLTARKNAPIILSKGMEPE